MNGTIKVAEYKKEWTPREGKTRYYFNVEMEDGTKGEAFGLSKTPKWANKGTEVNYEVKQDNKGNNNFSIRLAEGGAPPQQSFSQKPVAISNKDTLIIRQSCMKAAVDFINGKPTTERTPEKVIEVMKKFEEAVWENQK